MHEVTNVPVVLCEEAQRHRRHGVMAPAIVQGAEQVATLLKRRLKAALVSESGWGSLYGST